MGYRALGLVETVLENPVICILTSPPGNGAEKTGNGAKEVYRNCETSKSWW